MASPVGHSVIGMFFAAAALLALSRWWFGW